MIVIDGHNLLYSIQKASEEFEPAGDVRMCRIVGRYLELVGEKGEVVFDGIGPSDKSAFENISNLEVSFVGRATDADTVIENKIKTSTAGKRLTIVSSDRRLRDAGRAGKATVVKSDVFWDNLQRRLRRKAAVKEPAEKRFGLTESETEQWLKFFGLEQ